MLFSTVPQAPQTYCSVELTEKNLNAFRYAVKHHYWCVPCVVAMIIIHTNYIIIYCEHMYTIITCNIIIIIYSNYIYFCYVYVVLGYVCVFVGNADAELYVYWCVCVWCG